MKHIYLHGALGRRFGPHFAMDVARPTEALRALMMQLDGFTDALRAGSYRIIRGRAGLNHVELDLAFGSITELHIVPVAAGRGKGKSVGKIVLGVALIGAAFAFAPAAGVGGALFSVGGISITGTTVLGVGAALALGGISQLLSRNPKTPGRKDDQKSGGSFLFNGLTSVAEQGSPVPVVYGYTRISPIVISTGLDVRNIIVPPMFVNTSPPFEIADNLISSSIAYQVLLLGEGVIETPSSIFQKIRLNGTQLQNVTGTFNFNGLGVEFRDGSPNQAAVLNVPTAEREYAVGSVVKHDTPVEATVIDPNVTAINVKTLVNALYYIDAAQDIGVNYVTVHLDVKPNGGDWYEYYVGVIGGKTSSTYETEYRINTPYGGAPWSFRVRRAFPDSVSAKIVNEFSFASYTELIESRLTYRNSALIAIRYDAQQFGSQLPAITYEGKFLKINIPTNYDPINRIYTGIWDGTFQTAWSNNSAWVLYDLIINDRYGTGADVDIAMVDKWGLYEIAKYCDELVPDGKGGLEPRFSFNGSLTTQEEAYHIFSAVASSFRSITYWGGSAVFAAQDRPGPIKRIITPANVIGGTITYEGAHIQARHTVVVVTWTNPAIGYTPDHATVEDRALIARYGWKQTEIVAPGCTSEGLAHRLGRWVIETERSEPETASWRASLDNADLVPGDFVAIADPTRAGARLGGRLKALSNTQVKLDAPITLSAGVVYQIMIAMPDGTAVTFGITNSPGITDTLNVTPSMSVLPVTGAMWAILSSEVEPTPYRIHSIKENDKNEFEITASFSDPRKYDRADYDINLPEGNYSNFPTGPLAPPSNINATDFLYLARGTARSAIRISWKPSSDARVKSYEVEYLWPGEPAYRSAGIRIEVNRTIFDSIPGSYTFRVRSIDGLGQTSEWAYKSGVFLGLLAPPGDVPDLRIEITDTQARLTWDRVTDLDVINYRIRFTPIIGGGASWEGSSDLIEAAYGNFAIVPARMGTYFIKAVDSSGKESLNARGVTCDFDPVIVSADTVIIDDAPGWPGPKTNMIVIGNTLYLDGADHIQDWPVIGDIENLTYGLLGISPSGRYLVYDIIDLGGTYGVRVNATVDAFGENINNRIDSWASLMDVKRIDGLNPGSFSLTIQARTTPDDPASPSAIWSAWSNLSLSEYRARGLRFRLIASSFDKAVRVGVNDFKLTIDFPERGENGSDITCPVTGLHIPFTTPFHDIPAVAITGHGMASGDYSEMTGRNQMGFDIIFRDSTGAPVERTFDWIARGHGRLYS